MKTVLITGASSGFGFRTTLLLARHGYTIYAGVRNLQKKESIELKNIAEKENLLIHLVQLDVTKQSDVDGLKDILPSVNVLINNAGLGYVGAVEDYTLDEIKEQFEVNYFGVIRMIQAVIPYMRKNNNGMIINLSSISGLLSFPLYGIYSSSKFALETYSEVLRFELRPFGIKVALIEPGSFLTNFIKNCYFPKRQSDPASPYFSFANRFFKSFQKFDNLNFRPFLSSFFNPDRVSKRILKVIESKEPKLRNVVGIDAHLFLLLNHLPTSIKTLLLRKMYYW